MKKYWNNKDKRKGLIGTILFHAALILLFLLLGLSYMEPKPEKGIVINFGNSATGMGEQNDGAEANSTPESVERNEQTEEQVSEEINTPIQTQNTVDAPTVNTNPSQKTEPKEAVKEEEVKPQPSDALSRMLENVENTKAGGEGVQQGEGDQGDPDGDKDSPNRTGDSGGGGGGGDGNYLLGKRKALSKPIPDPCPDNNDVGRVVVKIYVDRNGIVTNAVPGEKIPNGKASTTTSSCLFSKAKSAAMRTTWQADGDAPAMQVGYIVYNFGKN